MKIGIITLPLHTNYGGLLQNFALQHVLKEIGHEPITLNWGTKVLPTWKRWIYPVVFWTLKNIFHMNVEEFGYQPNQMEMKTISRNTDAFINKYINKIDVINNSKSFEKIIEHNGYEAIIVGSDQVWRPMYNGKSLFIKYLDFAVNLNILRIAYAVSFGSSNWEYTQEQTERCKELIKYFEIVTVREDSGVKLCRKYLNVEAQHVLDPTMLLDKQVYESIVLRNNTELSEGDLFYYMLDPSEKKTLYVNKVAQEMDLRPFTVMPLKQMENRTFRDIKFHIEECVFPRVEKWIRAFMDAKFVICDSFHGCVFSIIFNKPFIVLGNPHRGNARFLSLLEMFGLQNRIVETDEPFEIKEFNTIEWKKVNCLRKQLIDKSLNILNDTFNNLI